MPKQSSVLGFPRPHQAPVKPPLERIGMTTIAWVFGSLPHAIEPGLLGNFLNKDFCV